MPYLNAEPPKVTRRRFWLGMCIIGALGALSAVVVNRSVEHHRDQAIEHAVDYSIEKAEDKFQDAKSGLKDKFQSAKEKLKEKFAPSE